MIMRAWWALAASLGVILLGYLADRLTGLAVAEPPAPISNEWLNAVLVIETLERIVAISLFLLVSWLVYRGPRSRPVGTAMLLVGLYVALVVPAFGVAWRMSNGHIPLPPIADVLLLTSPTNLTWWAGWLVTVLGIVELIWPSQADNG